MDADRIKQLLRREEGPKLDFKAILRISTESEKKELTKDVIAMANSRGGRGYILFGVEDKTKKVLGIDQVRFREEQIQHIIYNRSDPPVPVTVDFVPYEDVILAVITIYKSNHRPHQMLQNGAFYIRRGSTTDIARRSEIASMMQEDGLYTYETVPVARAKQTDLDQELLHSYFNNLQVNGEMPSDVLMEALGFIAQVENGEYVPTIGGMLLFGKEPSVFLPHCFIRIISKTRVYHVTGNIFSMITKATEHVRALLQQSDYPYEAFKEALANALLHRDYLDISRGVYVEIKDTCIEISNPGALLAGNSALRSMHENNPERRNPWLYQRLLTMERGNQFMNLGSGMSLIKEALAEKGKIQFVNLGSKNMFKVILPR